MPPLRSGTLLLSRSAYFGSTFPFAKPTSSQVALEGTSPTRSNAPKTTQSLVCALPCWISRRGQHTNASDGETHQREPQPVTPSANNNTSGVIYNEVTVAYVRGLPQLTIPLPSRREQCIFTLRPVSQSVGDLLTSIQQEDRGVDRVVARTTDGKRIAATNSIESLMENDFDLIINDTVYRVATPPRERLSREEMERLTDVQNLVAQLYEALNVSEHQLKKERELFKQLESLQAELEPLEKKRSELAAKSERRTTILTWTGLGLMAFQFGALARLTWWEYSWDIMEPVTYFVTYGTSVAAFAYYVLTKQDYVLPDVRDREFLFSFHKKARKAGFDVAKYNELKDTVLRVEHDLKRLKDPLRLNLPPEYFARKMDLMDSTNSSMQNPLWNQLRSFIRAKPN